MHKTHLYLSLILFTVGSWVMAAPRLTVVVLVDGLCQENLRTMQPFLPSGGLRTLYQEGWHTEIALSPMTYGGVETVADLLTGETPATHGVAMNTYFDRKDRRVHNILEDTREKGIGSVEQLSPCNLLSTTIADYFRLYYGKEAHIYAIGQDPTTTILMAGHAANACCWMDYQTQKWATTSFYAGGLPGAADEMNMSTRIADECDKEWTPRMNINMYVHPNEQDYKNPFHYRQGKILSYSPAINNLSVELALALQRQEHLGKNETPDLLLLQLTLLTPRSGSDLMESAEQEDQYLWVNQDLGYLMEQLDQRVGKENLQMVVLGIPRQGISQQTLADIGMPVKQFNVDRAAALTATYLMALYGKERWIDGGYGHSIFLNRTLIEQKRLSLETMQKQVANFLFDFEGIQAAYPMLDAYSDPQLAASLNKRTAGDVVFTLQPGWQLKYGDHTTLDQVLEQHPYAPVLIWQQPKSIDKDMHTPKELRQVMEQLLTDNK